MLACARSRKRCEWQTSYARLAENEGQKRRCPNLFPDCVTVVKSELAQHLHLWSRGWKGDGYGRTGDPGGGAHDPPFRGFRGSRRGSSDRADAWEALRQRPKDRDSFRG